MKDDLARLHQPKLAAWLAEFHLRTQLLQSLDREHPLPEEVRQLMATLRLQRAHGKIAVGEVRLLDPFATAATRTPLFVAILKDWQDGFFMICPFSPYSQPASPAELTVAEDPICAVLELWNILCVSIRALLPSYPTGVLSETLRQDITDFLAAGPPLLNQISPSLPWRLVRRTGPPIRQLDDPRWLHIREEKNLAAALGGTYQPIAEPSATPPRSADRPRSTKRLDR